MNTVPIKGDWPRWSITEAGYAGIAAYTPIEPPRRLQFARADAWMRTHGTDGKPLPGRVDHARELLRDLYAEFRARGYTYNIEAEPWSVDQGRSAVRDPFAIAHGSGTCLDFAVMFAAVCKLNLLRPIVLLLEREKDAPDGTGKQGEAHAIVVVDLFAGTDQPWGEAGYGDPWHVALNPLLGPGNPPDAVPAGAKAAASAVAWSDAAVHHGWRLGDRFVAIDVTAAARAAQPLGSEFAAACRGGEALLRAKDPGRTVAVEIIGANTSGVAEFAVSAEGAERRALHTDLPAPAGDFLRFPSRTGHEETFAPGHRIVLLGRSGSGKSWLARHVAGQADDGFGWWLDASSRSTLVGWLADAHSRELGLSTTQTRTKDDQQSLAEGAVRRLDEADGSWVVVYDNADGDPEEIDKLLPARPKENQLLIVTTTNRAWDRPGWRVVMVDAVPPAELAEHFKQSWNEQVRGLLGGLPLLAAATKTFAATVGRQWWEIEPPHEGDMPVDVPARIWTAAVRCLGAEDPVCRAAQAVAWLPPVTVPVAALAEIVPGSDGAAEQLTGYGLADAVVGSTDLRMHRLFSGAIRDVGTFVRGQRETDDFLAASAVLRAESSLNLLALHFDRRTIDALHGAVTATWREPYQRAVDLHRLGVAVERHDPEGAADFLTLARALVGAPIEGTEENECVRINVDGLRSLARPAARKLGRNASSEEVEAAVDQAIAWCIEAEELCAGRAEDHWPMTLARTQALHGIAVRGKGGLHKNRDRRRATELFEQSRVLLEESYRIRQVLDGGKGGFDVDRAQFNLAGLEVEFAQVDRRSKAGEHLAAARRHYTEVLEARRRRLRSDDYEDVACCHNGLAIVEYYTAVLVDQTPVEQARSLRSAAAYATKAADIRVRLQPQNSYDGADASKSVALLAKISLARLEVNQAGTGSGAFPFDYLAQFGLEWSGLAPGSALTLGADGKALVAEAAAAPRFKAVPAVGGQEDLRTGIAGWIGSPPLRALVEAFAREDEDGEQLRLDRRALPAAGRARRVHRPVGHARRTGAQSRGRTRADSASVGARAQRGGRARSAQPRGSEVRGVRPRHPARRPDPRLLPASGARGPDARARRGAHPIGGGARGSAAAGRRRVEPRRRAGRAGPEGFGRIRRPRPRHTGRVRPRPPGPRPRRAGVRAARPVQRLGRAGVRARQGPAGRRGGRPLAPAGRVARRHRRRLRLVRGRTRRTHPGPADPRRDHGHLPALPAPRGAAHARAAVRGRGRDGRPRARAGRTQPAPVVLSRQVPPGDPVRRPGLPGAARRHRGIRREVRKLIIY